MPQSGFTPLQIYSSSTTTNVPTAGNLTNSTQGAELAINIADGKLFYKDSGGVVQVLATKGGVGSSTTTQVLYNSSGLVVGSANLTFNGTTLTVANDASIHGLTVGQGANPGFNNTALGVSSLASSNSSSYNNTGVGYQSLTALTSANSNTATGFQALGQTTSGNSNSGFGDQALYANTTGASNTALGAFSLAANTTASNNTAVGYQAGYSNTTGAGFTAIGYQAGYSNTTSSRNLFVGVQAGYFTTGSSNTFVGQRSDGQGSGQAVTTGSNNTILGGYSGNQGGLDIRTASNYIVLSDGDGNPRGVFDGSGNFLVGTTATGAQNSNSFNTQLAFGQCNFNHVNGTGSGTGYAVFNYNGSTIGSITQNGTTGVLYNIVSDRRLKENIVDSPSALSLIDSVKVRSFDFKSDGSHTEFGLIAQEFYEVAPECVNKGDDNPDVITDTWGLDSSALVPAMIKAIQELKAEIDQLKGK